MQPAALTTDSYGLAFQLITTALDGRESDEVARGVIQLITASLVSQEASDYSGRESLVELAAAVHGNYPGLFSEREGFEIIAAVARAWAEDSG